MSMAPNAITLSGFGFVIINILTMLYYTPNLDQDCPPWVYASWSVGLFLYQTFDAVDGTQARRTGQSGPLGELFDHGVDALNTSLEVLLFAATMKFGQGWKTVLVLFASLLTFYVQTWDEVRKKTSCSIYGSAQNGTDLELWNHSTIPRLLPLALSLARWKEF